MTKIFLANPGGVDIAKNEVSSPVNKTEAELIKKLIPKRQFLFQQPSGAKVLNLDVDELSHRIFSNAKEVT